MLIPNEEVFLVIPEESTLKQRLLHPALVLDGDDSACTVSALERAFSPGPGDQLFVYHEIAREFMKQPAVANAIFDGTSPAPEGSPAAAVEAPEEHEGPIIGLTVTGDPVSAENREAYRVSTVTSGLFAAFGIEPKCQLLDVSATGFAVIARESYGVGDMIETGLTIGGESFTGSACVQSVTPLGKGWVRYGTYNPVSAEIPGGLAHGQRIISMEIQRQQLRRRTGS